MIAALALGSVRPVLLGLQLALALAAVAFVSRPRRPDPFSRR
jgi:hypothetical protein